MSNKPDLDDELAEFTDHLFSGDADEVSADNMIESRLVRQLHGMMTKQPQPSAAFRAKLTQRINQEWDVVHRQQSQKVKVLAPRFNRSMAMAAVIVTALLFVLVLLNPPVTPGAAGPGEILVPAIFMAAVLIIGALLLWLRRR